MSPLHTEIFNKLNRDGLKLEHIGPLIGSSKQELSTCKKKSRLVGFRKLLRLSYLLYPDNQSLVMEDWCLRLTTTESIKQAFEYASITRNKNLLRKLIDTYANETGVLSRYVSVYKILLDFYDNKISAKDIVGRLESIGVISDTELVILSKILKCYYLFYFHKYAYILEIAHEVERDIKNLTSRHLFIQECYLHRVAEILGNVSFYFNDIEMTRYYSYLIINAKICAKTVSDAYYLVGMTYLTESKEECLEMLTERYNITKKVNEPDLIANARKDLDLAKIYLGVKLPEDSDAALIKLQGNGHTRFEIKDVKNAIYHHGEEDIFTILEALSKNSINDLYQCRKKFSEEFNFFFASIAAREIKKAESTSCRALDELIDTKITTKGEIEFESNFIKGFNSYNSNEWSVTA